MKDFTEEEILAVRKSLNFKRTHFSARIQITKNKELILRSYKKGLSCRMIWRLLLKRNEFFGSYTSFLKAFNQLFKEELNVINELPKNNYLSEE